MVVDACAKRRVSHADAVAAARCGDLRAQSSFCNFCSDRIRHGIGFVNSRGYSV